MFWTAEICIYLELQLSFSLLIFKGCQKDAFSLVQRLLGFVTVCTEQYVTPKRYVLFLNSLGATLTSVWWEQRGVVWSIWVWPLEIPKLMQHFIHTELHSGAAIILWCCSVCVRAGRLTKPAVDESRRVKSGRFISDKQKSDPVVVFQQQENNQISRKPTRDNKANCWHEQKQ